MTQQRDTDIDAMFREKIMEFFNSSLHVQITKEEATYILVHRFESFAQAHRAFQNQSSESARDALLKIADAAIRYSSSHRRAPLD